MDSNSTASDSGSSHNACAHIALGDYSYPIHIASVFILMGVSLLGSGLPVLGSRLSMFRMPEIVTKIGRAFGTGVILATATVHMLPPAFQSLTSPCITGLLSKNYPSFAGALAMIAILVIQLVEFCVTSYYEEAAKREQSGGTKTNIADTVELKSESTILSESDSEIDVILQSMHDRLADSLDLERGDRQCNYFLIHGHSHHGHESQKILPPQTAEETHKIGGHSRDHHHGHHHGHSSLGGTTTSGKHLEGISEGLRRRIVAILLEAGIAFHSVIIGISLGVLAGQEFQSLLIALCLHQFFEGFALASTVVDAGFKTIYPKLGMILFYTVTTPSGVAIGVAIASSYDPNSPAALITQGVFDSISAGILLYMALVELLSYQYTNNPSFKQESLLLKCIQFACIYVGAGGMALIGIWT